MHHVQEDQFVETNSRIKTIWIAETLNLSNSTINCYLKQFYFEVLLTKKFVPPYCRLRYASQGVSSSVTRNELFITRYSTNDFRIENMNIEK